MHAALMYVYRIRRYIRTHTYAHTISFADAHQHTDRRLRVDGVNTSLYTHAANNCMLDTHTTVIVFWLKFKKPLVASTRSSRVNGFASAESELQPITMR